MIGTVVHEGRRSFDCSILHYNLDKKYISPKEVIPSGREVSTDTRANCLSSDVNGSFRAAIFVGIMAWQERVKYPSLHTEVLILIAISQ